VAFEFLLSSWVWGRRAMGIRDAEAIDWRGVKLKG